MKKSHKNIFYFLLLSVYFLFGINKTMMMSPRSLHAWRQADGAATASTLYNNSLNVFQLETYRVNEDGSKIAFGELPLPYFIPACLYVVFGENVFFFRLVTLVFSILGLLCVLKFSHFILKDTLFSILTAFVFISSPIFIVYCNSFLPDIHGVVLAFIGLLLFQTYLKENKNKFLYFSIFFFGLAGLVKITASIIYLAILFWILLLFLLDKKQFKEILSIKKMVLFMWPLPCFFFFYWFVGYVGKTIHPSGLFISDIVSYWSMPDYEQENFFSRLFKNTYWYFHWSFFVFLLIAIGISIYNFIHSKLLFLETVTVLVLLGSLFYFGLFIQRFQHHYYYYIEIIPAAILLTIGLFKFLKEKTHSTFLYIIKVSLIILFVFQCVFSNALFRLRYLTQENPIADFLVNKEDREFLVWFNGFHYATLGGLENIRPYLREKGIRKDDIVVSLPDLSPNISLHLIKQPGFTNHYFDTMDINSEQMEFFKTKGAKYLIINDPNMLSNEKLQPYFQNKIGEYGHVTIFHL